MRYKITERNGATGKTIVSSNDQNLTHDQAKANMAKHEKMWRKFGGEIIEISLNKMVGRDSDGTLTTWTIEQY